MISLSAPGAAAVRQARARLAAAVGDDHEAAELLARFDRWAPDLWNGLAGAYDAETVLPRFIDLIAAAHLDRSPALRARDTERLLMPDWFQRPEALGYVAYADRFAGDLAGVQSHIDYLSDLGVTYLHLMPLLEPRPAPNDGGYAVMDYRKVRSDLGTMQNLRELAAALHEAGIALTLDLVLNHVAQEHEWAIAARGGDAAKREYFLTYPDRTLPDQYERSLPEVFPAFAPGNFTWDDSLDAWVWTTFNTWQWDLNWSNPDVLCEFADIILFLANQGVDCIRLDAIAFLWKRMGTDCQGQPEVHAITHGSAASLAGIESALEARDDAALSLAIDKVLCGYAIVLGFGGIPLIYMGDEIGLLNDYSFVDEPEHAADNRWLHRPMMDWPRATAAPASSEYSGRILRGLTELIEARKDCDALHAATPPEIFHGADSAVLVLRRRHPAGTVVQVFNMAGSAREIAADALWPLDTSRLRDLVSGSEVSLSAGALRLPAYGVLWLVDSPAS